MNCPRCHEPLVGVLQFVRGTACAGLVHDRCLTPAEQAEVEAEAKRTVDEVMTANTDPRLVGAPLPRPKRRLRRVCMHCRTVMDAGDPGAPTSHGICEDCLYRHYPDVADQVMDACGKEPRNRQAARVAKGEQAEACTTNGSQS